MTEPRHKLQPYNVKFILTNVESVFKSGNISKLSKASYRFIYLMSGFIAHYDLYGFQNYYQDLRIFAQDLLDSLNSYSTPEHYLQDCFIQDYGYEYCKSEADIAIGLKEIVLKYNNQVYKQEEAKDKDKLSLLEATIAKVKSNPEATQKFLARLGM